MNREERNAFYADKNKREAIEAAERAIKRFEAMISPLEAARVLADEGNDPAFVNQIDEEIYDHQCNILIQRRNIIKIKTGAVVSDRSF